MAVVVVGDDKGCPKNPCSKLVCIWTHQNEHGSLFGMAISWGPAGRVGYRVRQRVGCGALRSSGRFVLPVCFAKGSVGFNCWAILFTHYGSSTGKQTTQHSKRLV